MSTNSSLNDEYFTSRGTQSSTLPNSSINQSMSSLSLGNDRSHQVPHVDAIPPAYRHILSSASSSSSTANEGFCNNTPPNGSVGSWMASSTSYQSQDVTPENSTVGQNNEIAYDQSQWRRISGEIQFVLPGRSERTQGLWKELLIKLHQSIETQEEERRSAFRHTYHDFCVIHGSDAIDLQITKWFIGILLRDGLTGVSAMKKYAGENRLDIAENLINGSSRIFVLLSPTLNIPGIHRTFYQDVFLRRFEDSSWRNKLIPLRPSNAHLQEYRKTYFMCNPIRLPLGLNTISAIKLSDIYHTVNEVREVLTLDRQNLVAQNRDMEIKNFESGLNRRRQVQLGELRRGLEALREQLGEEGDPTSYLVTMNDQLHQHLTNHEQNEDHETLINMNDCNQTHIGTAINFNFGGAAAQQWE